MPGCCNARIAGLLFLIASTPAAALESTIAGAGAVSGTVTAARPFTAAQVYLKSTDKPVTFMVYTANIRPSM